LKVDFPLLYILLTKLDSSCQIAKQFTQTNELT
jgi:hypothetical protein